MHEFNVGLLVLAGSALTLGLISKRLKLIGLPSSLVLLLLGIILGPTGFNALDPKSWGEPMAIMEQVARLALAVGLMDIALRLPRTYILKHWRTLALVLGVGMPFMWLCSSAIVGGILGLSAGAALVIGAAVTPTDPVVASTIVTGPVAEKSLPSYLRQIISAESGANDGLAYLFVLTATFLVTSASAESLTTHVLAVLFGDVLSALLIGGLIGYSAGLALKKAEEKKWIEKPSILMFTTALAFTTLAAVKLMGSDGILAVLIAGLAFDQQVDAKQRREEEHVMAGIDLFFTSPVFILLGLMIPWKEWLNLGWPALALIIAILLLRRLPLFLLLGGRSQDLPKNSDGAFSGWFGPIGVAALYYAALAHHKTDIPELWPAVSLLVVASIAIHGLTALPLSRLYEKHSSYDKPH